MKYREIYSIVIADEQSGVANPRYRTPKEKVTAIWQLVFSHGYKEETNLTKEDAYWLACELYEDMTGRYFDATEEEYEQMLREIH